MRKEARGARRWRLWVWLGVVAAGLLAGGIAYATIPGSDGVVTGCVRDSNGMLRVIDAEAGETCRRSETQLTWSSEDRFASAVSAHRRTGPSVVTMGAPEATVSFTELAAVELAPGSYIAFGKTRLIGTIEPGGDSEWGGECILTTGVDDAAGLVDETSSFAPNHKITHWNLQGYLLVAPSQEVVLRLMCNPGVDFTNDSGETGFWSASDSSLVAIAIPDVTHTELP